ncbi:MAG: hypothetical protein ABI744_04685 [Chloroflexota bacterium]
MYGSPFAAIEVLLIDGNNLLHRRSGDAGEGALRGLLPRLNAAIPQQINTIVMLDGYAAQRSARAQRIRHNLELRHAGSRSADDALLALISDTPIGARAMTTLVTDDRALTEKARHLGCHTFRLDWLEALLNPTQPTQGQARPVSLGNRRPPRR